VHLFFISYISSISGELWFTNGHMLSWYMTHGHGATFRWQHGKKGAMYGKRLLNC